MIGWLVERYKKNNKKRENMCLSELEKEVKKRKYVFIVLYCGFFIFAYIGFIVSIGLIISLLFFSLIFGILTVITAIDYIFTKLLYYLKLNIEG